MLDLVGVALRDRMRSFASDATTWRGWLTDFAHLVRDHLAPSVSSVLVDLGSPGLSDRVGVGEAGLALLIADGFTPTEAGYAVWLVFRIALTAGTPDEPSFAGFVREATPVLDRDPVPAAGAAADVPATRPCTDALADGRSHDSFALRPRCRPRRPRAPRCRHPTPTPTRRTRPSTNRSDRP